MSLPQRVPSFHRWPKSIPRLFPDLSNRDLGTAIKREQYDRIIQWPLVEILPLVAEKRDPMERSFGVGLSAVLNRDLMLVRGLSVTPLEETQQMGYDQAFRLFQKKTPHKVAVTGHVKIRDRQFRIKLRFLFPDGTRKKVTLRENELDTMISNAAATITETVGGSIGEGTLNAWKTGRPCNFDQVVQLGQILSSGFDARERSRAAINLWKDDCKFSTAINLIDVAKQSHALELMLESITEHDRFNAPLCFQIFRKLYQEKGYQPEAFQFLRRAIELSPGFAKAHVWASVATSDVEAAGLHAELGHHLSPGDSTAIGHYILHLRRNGKQPMDIMHLANEGIECDAKDPTSYNRMIELLEEIKDYRGAIGVAERLQRLYEPRLDPQARVHLMKDPKIRDALTKNKFDPGLDNRARIDRLKNLAAAEDS